MMIRKLVETCKINLENIDEYERKKFLEIFPKAYIEIAYFKAYNHNLEVLDVLLLDEERSLSYLNSEMTIIAVPQSAELS